MSNTAYCYLLHGIDTVALFENSVASLRSSGVGNEVHVFTTAAARDACARIGERHDVRVVEIDPGGDLSDHYHDYDSKAFNAFVAYKFNMLLGLLEAGVELAVYVDVDIGFRRDPTSYLEAVAGQYGMAFQTESLPVFPPQLCTGFMSWKGSDRARGFLRNMIKVSDKNKAVAHDQTIMNGVLAQNPGLLRDMFLLPEALFPNGMHHDQGRAPPLDYVVRGLEPFIFHANFTVGVENKIRLLKDVGLWVLP